MYQLEVSGQTFGETCSVLYNWKETFDAGFVIKEKFNVSIESQCKRPIICDRKPNRIKSTKKSNYYNSNISS